MQDENEKMDSSENENQKQESQENAEQDSKESLQNKIKELEDQYLRTYADFENTKKRLVREKDQALEYAYEKIAKDLK